MNPDLERLQTYPFQKLTALLEGARPSAGKPPIALYIGEPKHATPEFIKRALVDHLDGLAGYPPTAGGQPLRAAIAEWVCTRYGLDAVDPVTQVIPVTGSREALFAFAQAVVDRSRPDPVVVCPNPFYQIYEGAALLAGATPHYLNTLPQRGYTFDFGELPEPVWKRVQLLYVCSPGNPTGHVMTRDEWSQLFALSDRYGFVVASDECYSEIYFEEGHAPLGALQAAAQEAGVWMTSKYDHGNPAALKRLVASGAVLRPFPQDVMDTCYRSANELYAELVAKNEWFKRMYDNVAAYRSDQYLWWQVAEYTMDSYMIRYRNQRT